MQVATICALLVGGSSARAHSSGDPADPADAIIGNDTIELGLHPQGHLNVPGIEPGEIVGLRFAGADAISPGCHCEGWGVADAETGLTAYADQNDTPDHFNLAVESFTATATTATSVVRDDPLEGPASLRVTHAFAPAAETDNLYQVTVSIENLTDAAIADLRYRRVMDWDVPPTAFSEFVTIDGTAPPELLYSNNNGFATANPLGSRTAVPAGSGGGPPSPVLESLPNEPALDDAGPQDHGSLFDFGFGSLPAGATQTFTFYYGGAATETAALAAIDAVGADLYSLGQPSSEGGASEGTPNTFIFAYDSPDSPADATISLDSPDSVIAGAQSVPTTGINTAELRQTVGGTTQSTPLDSIPLDSIPLDSVPLDSIPLDSIGLTSDLLNEAFGGVHLSDIPLAPPDAWEDRLEGTPLAGVPLNTITLADVYEFSETSLNAAPLDSIPLDSIDLSQTPLDSIALGAIALGATPLDSIPLDSIGNNDAGENADDWCDAIDAVPGYACPGPGSPGEQVIDPSTETLVGVTVRGVPLDSIPLDSIPLDSIPLDSIPLDSIPLDSIPLDSIDTTGSPLDSIPLDSIDFAVSPLDSIPLDSIDIANSPLDSIPLDSILLTSSPLDSIPLDSIPVATRDQIVDCSAPYDCSGKSLGQAHDDGQLKDGAKLGHLAGELGDFTLGDLVFYGDVTLGQLIEALLAGHGASVADLIYGLPSPPELTLGDIFALLLYGNGAYDWSDLDLATFPIAKHSPDGGVITYEATFTVTGGPSPTTATIHATLPSGGLYKEGSTTLQETDVEGEPGSFDDPTLSGNQLEWQPEVDVGTEYRLTWQVHAPIELGDYSVGANVIVPGMAGAALSSPASVEVTQTLEENDTPGDGPTLAEDTLYLSYMLQGDVDRFVVPIPAAFGSRTKITLSHLAAGTDLDLTVAGPPSPTLRSAPLDSIPLLNGQLPDTEVDLDEPSQELPPETLQDVPTDALTTGPQAGNVIRATSDNRGDADEEVVLISQGEGGNYLVQVSDYQGDSPLPYMLEVEVEGPPALGPCAQRTFDHPTDGIVGTMPLLPLPSNVNTLILVNKKRLGDTYGAAAMNDVMAKLNELAGRSDLGIVGAVIPVEADPDVARAYAGANPIPGADSDPGWDDDPCSPARANDVVREIGELVDSIEPPDLRYKVIVGGDDQLPFGRVADETLIANERTYVQSLPGPNNQYKGAFGNGFLLTDDVYVEEGAPKLFGHELLVPDQAVGRLVETPDEMIGMIDDFLAANGAIAPQRSLTTGYDFLTDGAIAVNTPFTALFGAANTTELISETWNATDLDTALFPGSNPPQIASVNAHFDHTRLLPAAENAANRAANLYVSQDVRDRGVAAVAARVLSSMGCHSGLPISDAIFGGADPIAADWAQTFVAGGAFAWIGNTGYGLGETVEVAYTERLHALLAANMDGSLSLGEALAQAKQEYLSELAIIGGYDAKVVMQTTLFGLPMLDVGSAPPQTNPPPLPTHTDPATGLTAASFNVSPSFTLETTPHGSFYRSQTTQTTNRRPIQPALSFDVTQPGKVAHGIVITSLQSADDQDFDAAFTRVTQDNAEDEPEIVGEVSHPAKIQSLSTFSSFASPSTTRQNAVLIAGLYRGDANPDGLGLGTQRRYTQIGGYVLYADPSVTNFTPPELGPLEAQEISGGVGFAVDVTAADGTVEDVKVIYRDCGGTWRLSTLQPSGGDRWSGGGPLSPPGCLQIDYYLQAVSNLGDVAVSSKKVQVEPLTLPSPTGSTPITITPSGPQHSSGWYTGDVDVTISPSTDMEYSLDGAAFVDYSAAFSVTGDGVHTVKARAADGSTNTAGFGIDTTAPTIEIRTPANGGKYVLGSTVPADYTCPDSGSGAATCTGTVPNGEPIDTSSVGEKTFTVNASDVVGNNAPEEEVTYEVVRPRIVFASSRTGNGDIYAVPQTGGTPALVVAHPSIDAEPEWFPSHDRIVWTSSRSGNGDIYSMKLDGTPPNQLTSHTAIDTSPAVSPDGTKIAFSSNRNGNWDIYVMNADGSNPTRLTTDKKEDLLPTWSPNGAQIAFMSKRTGGGDIYTMNANGTSQTKRTSGNAVDSEPAWSPNGSLIAFSTNRDGSSNYEIYTITPTGGSLTRRTVQAGNDITPAWAPDGLQLAFASNRAPAGGANYEIYTMPFPPTGSATAVVTHPAIDSFPDW